MINILLHNPYSCCMSAVTVSGMQAWSLVMVVVYCRLLGATVTLCAIAPKK